MMQSLANIANRIRTFVLQLNLFEDERTRLDQFHLRTAIISTRVYVTLLTLAVIVVLVALISLETQSEAIIIRNPSEANYQTLLKKNLAQLLCPCSRITIPYGNFTSTAIAYHPVCSSVFVTNDWIRHFFSSDIGKLYQPDFRVLASSYFQLLAALCFHAKRSVHDALDDFDSETLITPSVFTQDNLNSYIQEKTSANDYPRQFIANSNTHISNNKYNRS
ncbi:unnamed protein product [Adineta ricciae]|uniref:Uncharacterized protein n=1 Tax=Adineta ricciae TaxID=249248 RepID=A0A815YQM1_ADIRI|nr:unnamed protein product [Adineta ricciae]